MFEVVSIHGLSIDEVFEEGREIVLVVFAQRQIDDEAMERRADIFGISNDTDVFGVGMVRDIFEWEMCFDGSLSCPSLDGIQPESIEERCVCKVVVDVGVERSPIVEQGEDDDFHPCCATFGEGDDEDVVGLGGIVHAGSDEIGLEVVWNSGRHRRIGKLLAWW